jgi:hypothetical protein
MSDKAYAGEQNLDDARPGPWTWFTPLTTGWGPGANGFAFARYYAFDNSVEIMMDISRTGTNPAHAIDGYQIGTMPAQDGLGNPLRPVGLTTTVNCGSDHLQTTTPGSPRLRITPSGIISIFGVASASTWLRAISQHYTIDDLSGSGTGGGSGGGGTDPAPPVLDTSWHAIPLIAGWTNSTPTAQYRLHPTMPSCVEFIGDIVPGTKADGTAICSALPSAYLPVTGQSIHLMCTGNTVVSIPTSQFRYGPGGILTVQGVNVATLTNIRFHGFIDLVI